MASSVEAELKRLYYDSPHGLSTAKRLHHAAKKNGMKVSLKRVESYLKKWEVYTRFKNKYKEPSLQEKVIVTGPFHLWQIDLCLLPKYRNFIGALIWFYLFQNRKMD